MTEIIGIKEFFVAEPDSPYLHVFDRLNCVHHQMDEDALLEAMNDIHYKLGTKEEQLLPNGKN